MKIMEIQEDVQRIAEAIASVLNLEVEIADEQLVRVAGTGKTSEGVLRKMEGDLVYQSAIRTGGPVIIENPGYEEICKHCVYYGNCPESGEICMPIQIDDHSVGVIGLLAFDENQRNRLFENVDHILDFLDKMADLLVGKLKEHLYVQTIKVNSEKINTMMNYIHQGIITVDCNNYITDINAQARAMLNLPSDKEINFTKLNEHLIKEITNMEKRMIPQKVVNVDLGEYCTTFYLELCVIDYQFETSEKLLVLHDLDSIQNLAKETEAVHMRAFDRIVGDSSQMRDLKQYAFQISKSDSTICIQGESGTGKEEFAQAIHWSSQRKNQPFISINCGAIPENLLESELFGYEEGAFTGAKKQGKKGKILLAEGGTLFLDEIGEMPSSLQVKLLRVLQERKLEPIGGNSAIPINIRIITATNQKLYDLITKGEFREDLYYRLNVIPLHLPPLRSRKEDIRALSDHFIAGLNQSMGKGVLGFQEEVLEKMIQYEWPGNIRELKNYIEYIMNFIEEGMITKEVFDKLFNNKSNSSPITTSQENFSLEDKQDSLNLKDIEKDTILKAITLVEKDGESKEKAIDLLGLSRATFYRKCKKYNL